MGAQKVGMKRVDVAGSGPAQRTTGRGGLGRRRRPGAAGRARQGLTPMGEREIAALLRQVEGDDPDDWAGQGLEEIIDAAFDEDAGPSDHLDLLADHERSRASMRATLDDEHGGAW